MSAVLLGGLLAALLALAVLAWPSRLAAPGPRRTLDSLASARGTGSAPEPRRAGPRLRRRGPEGPTSGEVAEVARLLVAALRSGIGLLEALEVVADLGPPAAGPDLRRVVAAQRWGSGARQAWAGAHPRWAPLATGLAAAEEAGLSPVRSLAAAADQVERERAATVRTAVGRLDVLVVLPLGLAFLPGFVLTTVVPVVAGLALVTLDGAR